jgi:Protein of unknown function (DUF3429)
MDAKVTISPLPVRLGYLGLLPQFVFLAMALSGGPAHRFALAGGFAYAALIFSFLGGVWWGLALTASRQLPWLFAISVMPSLIALGCFLPWVWGLRWPEPYLLVLGVLLAMSCLVDLRAARALNLPVGWTKMRTRLSLGLGLTTFLLGLV